MHAWGAEVSGNPQLIEAPNDAPAHGELWADYRPACSKCHAIHPLTYNEKAAIKVDPWSCQVCGHPSAPGFRRTVKLRLPGVLGFVVDVCYGIGNSLRRAAERLRK